ncbi:MAG: polysaccharide biosynthesis protein [Polaromonas sp.]
MDSEQQSPSSAGIISQIAALAPSGATITPAVLEQLRAATQQLITIFMADGKLDQSPSALAMDRTVTLHREAAEARLKGQRVLVTGGAGCVGTRLIPLLVDFGAAEIAIVDIAEQSLAGVEHTDVAGQTTYKVDIRDAAALHAVFAAFKPQVVFHLAGIREPGRAEAVVREAIETNVFGTRNVINACLRHGVEDAIYSSTGKCFAYVTEHVYTGSKKLAEAQWVGAARQSASTRFRCTRFTHIMENGLVALDIAEGIDNGLVRLHGPDRYFNIQNLRQATHLLVNALALAEQTPADGFWSAVDLGWPVNTLELALYKIQHSGAPAAICFLGVPRGYDEAFFRGQFCWNGESEYHPLINALEAPASFGDSTGSMVGARVQPFNAAALAVELDTLERALREVTLDVVHAKDALTEAVDGLARAIFAAADLPRLIDVLWWGAAPAWAGAQASEAARFWRVIGLLTDAVVERLSQAPGPLSTGTWHKLLEVGQTLSQVDCLSAQAESLNALLVPSRAQPHENAAVSGLQSPVFGSSI